MINFDQVIDRTAHHARKWDPAVLSAHFGRNDVLPMWIADMDFFCPPAVVAALEKTARQGIYGYTFVPEAYDDAVMLWSEKRHQWKINRDWITLTHGTVSTLHYIVQEFCVAGDQVIVQTPGYDPFESAVKNHGARLSCNLLQLVNGRYELDFADLERRAKTAKLMIFCSPHNPTGRVWTAQEIRRAAEICLNNEVLMVVDEIHKDLLLYGNRNVPMTEFTEDITNNCIICASPNKAFNFGGLKSSYTIIPNEKIRKRLKRRLKINSITSPNVFAVPALVAAYTESDVWLEQLIHYIEGNFDYVKRFLAENLPQVNLIAPEATYLAWLDLRSLNKNEEEIKDWLINTAKVGVSFGGEFISGGEGFIRMNLGCPRAIVIEAMQRLCR